MPLWKCVLESVDGVGHRMEFGDCVADYAIRFEVIC